MKKFSFSASKYTIDIFPFATWRVSDCNYTTITAWRQSNGFKIELHHVIKRNDDIVKIHYHNIGFVRTVADVYDVACEYVKTNKVYKMRINA